MKNNIAAAALILLSIGVQSFAADVPLIPSNAPVKNVQNVARVTSEPRPAVVTTSFENCVRNYNTSVENLYFLTLAAINASGYKIDEMQSRTGYISFSAGGKMLLASITKVNAKSSMIKITPMDNSYSFQPALIEKIFTYLSNNAK